MLEHIVTVDPVIFDVPEDECATIRQQLAPVFERIQAAGPSVSALQQINEVLSDYQCISWWGTPDDLMRGNSKFALQLRAEFRDGGQSTPIEASELDAFACFLSEYGV
jgi:hypothetical protein